MFSFKKYDDVYYAKRGCWRGAGLFWGGCTSISMPEMYDCIRSGDRARAGREVQTRTYASMIGNVYGCAQMSLVLQLCYVGYTIVCAVERAHMCGECGGVAMRQSPFGIALRLRGRCVQICFEAGGIRRRRISSCSALCS